MTAVHRKQISAEDIGDSLASVHSTSGTVVVIDCQVADWQVIHDAVPEGAEIILIEQGSDGLQVLSDALAHRTAIEALHIFSHGSSGRVQLGTTWLDSDSLATEPALSNTLKNAMSTDGDILVYGCNVADGEQGQMFVELLAALSGADVAASDNLTGSTGLANDWNLEFSSGTIGAATLSVTAYSQVLVEVLNLPTLVATGETTTFTENGNAVDLFSTVTAATNDSSQTFSDLTLTVTNVSDGAAEILAIGGTDIALYSHKGLMTDNGRYYVNLSNGVATLDLASLTLEDDDMGALIDTITYRNTSENPSDAERTVTITKIKDYGVSNNIASPNISATVSVTSINDRPVLDKMSSPELTPIVMNADAPLNGVTTAATVVSSLLQGATDVDGDTLGVAITHPGALNSLYYSIDEGNTWSLAGKLGENRALLLGGSDLVYYKPVADELGPRSTFTFKAWDGTSSEGAGEFANLTYFTSDTSPYSVDADKVWVTVTTVNHAPTISNHDSYVLPGTDENSASGGKLVSAILSGVELADADSGAAAGIAVTAVEGYGTWRFSTDGDTWTDFPTLSANEGLLLAATTLVRYVPDEANGESASLSFRAWDQTSGTASSTDSAQVADVRTNGGTTAFSTSTAFATIAVSSVNDAPLLDVTASPSLITLAEDTAAPVNGETHDSTVVSSLFGGISDVDHNAQQGIAITAVNTEGGTLWHSVTDGEGTSGDWTKVSDAAADKALLLDNNDRLYWQPDAEVNGSMEDAFTFRAWDRSGNGNDTTVNGGATAFSAATDTVAVNVYSLNDRPVLDDTFSPALTTMAEDAAAPQNGVTTGATLVSSLLEGATDIDGDTLGMAITHPGSSGSLYFSINAGTSWSAASNLGDHHALLLGGSDLVYFKPAVDEHGQQDAFTFKAWDATSSEGAGDYVDLTYFTSEMSPYSAVADTVSVSVTAVNDAPILGATDGLPATKVDGATVTDSAGTAPDGTPVDVTEISIVPSDRDEQVGESALANIPLVSDNGSTRLEVGLPAGTGMRMESHQAAGKGTPGGLSGLLAAIRARTNTPDAQQDQQAMTSVGTTFMQDLPDAGADLIVRTLVPTVDVGVTSAPLQAIRISAPPPVAGDKPMATVIDVRGLPSGSVIELQNIQFVAIVGEITMTGGAGSQVVTGDGSRQIVVLGEDDDIIRGGGGDDFVGSRAGDDRLYGDDGNDHVIGGAGNDYLEGGAGDDVLQGGASDAGVWHFALVDGQLVSSFAAQQPLGADGATLRVDGPWWTQANNSGQETDHRLQFTYETPDRMQLVATLYKAAVGERAELMDYNHFVTSSMSEVELAHTAVDHFFNNHDTTTQVLADKVALLITAVWGEGAATDETIATGTEFIASGGSWAEGMLTLARSENAQHLLQDANGNLQLVKASATSELGRTQAESGDDVLIGGAGNDRLVGGGGNNLLDGGDGTDVAVYTGAPQDFSFQLREVDGQEQLLLTALHSGFVDVLQNIELLKIGGYYYAPSETIDALPYDSDHALSDHLVQLTGLQVQAMDLAGVY